MPFSFSPVSEKNNSIRLVSKPRRVVKVVKYLGRDIYADIMAPNDALFVRSSAGPRWKMNDPGIRTSELMTVYYDN